MGRRVVTNGVGLLRDAVVAPLASRVPREWVTIRLDHGLVEASAASAWLSRALPTPRVLPSVLECVKRASADPRVRGILVRVGRAPLGWSKVQSLVRALAELRSAGKRFVVYAETTGNAGMWLGAGADRFFMAPGGQLALIGLRMESPYLRGALDRLKIRPEVIHAGRYKAAGEILSGSSMSESAREALDDVADALYDTLVAALAAGRARDPEQARRWIDEGPYLAREALERGLVDELIYADELPARLAALAEDPPGSGEDQEASLIEGSWYLRVARRRFRWEPVGRGWPRIAIVPVLGLIRAGSSRGVVSTLRRLRQSPEIRAVVLRIDSRGGDPLASDLIWRAVARLAAEKPVVASLGDIAASGGYYAAMAAHEIIAESATLTGSIGVVLASLEVKGLLDDLGIQFDGVSRGRHARIFDPWHSRSGDERAHLRRQVDGLYREFVRKAAEGRGIAEAALEEVAQGRVWTGAQARDRALVDGLGGLEVALERARALAGLASGEGETVQLPVAARPLARLMRREPLETMVEHLAGLQLFCPVDAPLR